VKKMLLFFFLIGMSVFLLNGCMMMGMHGMSGHDASNPMSPPGNMIIKEVHSNNVDITLKIPPLLTDLKSSITLQIYDTKSGLPLSGAFVLFSFREAGQLRVENDKEISRSTREYNASETANNGTYKLEYIPKTAGLIEIGATIQLPGTDTSNPLTVMATQQVVQASASQSKMSGMKPMAIMGGAGMLVMMVVMMLGGFWH